MKNLSWMSLLIGGFAGFLLAAAFFSNQSYNGKTAREWASVVNTNQASLTKMASNAQQWKDLYQLCQNEPTPTPVVEYQTQYQYVPQQPTSMHCFSYGTNNQFSDCNSD